jgi:hypothetical protein
MKSYCHATNPFLSNSFWLGMHLLKLAYLNAKIRQDSDGDPFHELIKRLYLFKIQKNYFKNEPKSQPN